MGKKKTEEVVQAPVDNKAEEDDDTAVIKTLKGIDDKYCAIEIEFEAEVAKLRQKMFNDKQATLLTERAKVLDDATGVAADDQVYGTPACKGFWLQAFQNADVFAEILEEHDEPVIEYLQDVKRTYTDPEHPQKGFKLDFVFKENPYFSNSSVWMECVVDYSPDTYKPYLEPKCLEIKSAPIEWKAGKNVTVEMVAKKTKGGGAKKAKQKAKAPKEEPRESLFRILFRNLKQGDPAPEDLKAMMGGGEDDDDDENDEQIVNMFLEQLHEIAHSISEEIIPYAVRYYTGEAGDVESDDDDEEEEEEDDDDDDDEDSDEEPAPKKKGQKKPAAGGKPAAGQKEEECKQQ